MEDLISTMKNSLKLLNEELVVLDLGNPEGICLEAPTTNTLLARVLTSKKLSFWGFSNFIRDGILHKGGIKVSKASYDLFRLDFELQQDHDNMLNGGPWNYDQQLIVFEPIKLSSSLATLQFRYVIFTVIIMDLPMFVFYGDNLKPTAKQIGDSIGVFIEVDNNLEVPDGTLALRIRIDLSKPLPRGFVFRDLNGDRSWASCKYDRLPNFCFRCGLIGHVEDICSLPKCNQSQRPFGRWMRYDNNLLSDFQRAIHRLSLEGRKFLFNDQASRLPALMLEDPLTMEVDVRGSEEGIGDLLPDGVIVSAPPCGGGIKVVATHALTEGLSSPRGPQTSSPLRFGAFGTRSSNLVAGSVPSEPYVSEVAGKVGGPTRVHVPSLLISPDSLYCPLITSTNRQAEHAPGQLSSGAGFFGSELSLAPSHTLDISFSPLQNSPHQLRVQRIIHEAESLTFSPERKDDNLHMFSPSRDDLQRRIEKGKMTEDVVLSKNQFINSFMAPDKESLLAFPAGTVFSKNIVKSPEPITPTKRPYKRGTVARKSLRLRQKIGTNLPYPPFHSPDMVTPTSSSPVPCTILRMCSTELPSGGQAQPRSVESQPHYSSKIGKRKAVGAPPMETMETVENLNMDAVGTKSKGSETGSWKRLKKHDLQICDFEQTDIAEFPVCVLKQTKAEIKSFTPPGGPGSSIL